MLRLVLPDSAFLSSYVEALREGYRLGVRSTPSEDEIQKIEKDPHDHFKMLNKAGGYWTFEDGVRRARVDEDYLWLIEDMTFIGGIAIRPFLNDFLEIHAGHIGYGVRPSKMKQGYATKMLALALEILKEREVDKVLITADESNPASWRTIEANGGVLEDRIESVFHKGSYSRRYWIKLNLGQNL